MHADHYNQLTKAYWAIFSLIYVCAILILAVGTCLFGFNLTNCETACSLRQQVRTYTLDTLPFDYRILWNAGEYIISIG